MTRLTSSRLCACFDLYHERKDEKGYGREKERCVSRLSQTRVTKGAEKPKAEKGKEKTGNHTCRERSGRETKCQERLMRRVDRGDSEDAQAGLTTRSSRPDRLVLSLGRELLFVEKEFHRDVFVV